MKKNKNRYVKIPLYAWFVAFVGALFYGYQFILRICPQVMNHEMIMAWGVDVASFGFLISLYYWSYSSMQIPAGLLLDRFGPRRVLSLAALVCFFGVVGLGMAQGPWIAGMSRFAVGFGSAFAFIGALKVLGNWLPSNRLAFATGLVMAMGTVCAFVAGGPLARLVDLFGWQMCLYVLAVGAFIISTCIYTVISDFPLARHFKGDEAYIRAIKKENPEDVLVDVWWNLKSVFWNPQSWYAGISLAFLYLPLACFAELWGAPFIMKCCGCDRAEGAAMTSLLFVGMAIGAPLFGAWSDRIKRRKLPLYTGITGLLTCFLILIIGAPSHLGMIAVLVSLIGFFVGSMLILFSMVRENNPSSASGLSVAFGNFICMVIPGVAQSLVGYLLVWISGISAGSDVLAYSTNAYQWALLTIPVGVGLSYVSTFFTRETYAEQGWSAS